MRSAQDLSSTVDRPQPFVVDADVWVLTETTLDHPPGDGYSSVFTPAHPTRRRTRERWVGIWSRFPIRMLTEPAPHPRGSVAAQVDLPTGPVIVYGTVIAWANEKLHDNGEAARMWEVHLAEIERQGKECRRLRDQFPFTPLIVAGDFNQDRDGSGWYGTKEDSLATCRASGCCWADVPDVCRRGVSRSVGRRSFGRPHLRYSGSGEASDAVLGNP